MTWHISWWLPPWGPGPRAEGPAVGGVRRELQSNQQTAKNHRNARNRLQSTSRLVIYLLFQRVIKNLKCSKGRNAPFGINFSAQIEVQRSKSNHMFQNSSPALKGWRVPKTSISYSTYNVTHFTYKIRYVAYSIGYYSIHRYTDLLYWLYMK